MWKQKTESLCVLCDVGSAVVAASFVLFSSEAKPRILFTTFVPISITEKPDLSHMESLISAYIKDAFAKLSREGLVELRSKGVHVGQIKKIYVSLASPWFISKTTERSVSEKNTFTFNEDLVKTMLEEEEREFESQTTIAGSAGGLANDMRMIERKVIDVSLNGYPTLNPFGKKARNAQISLYMSLANEEILSSIRTVAEDHFHDATVYFHSFPLVSYGALQDLFPHEREYLFFDVAGEFSHVFRTQNGSIRESGSFQSGRNPLLRAIKAENETIELARSALALWKDGSSGGLLQSETKTKLAGFVETWIADCGKMLRTLTASPLPKLWFLIADEEVEEFFTAYLHAVAVTMNIPSTIIAIDHSHVEGKIGMEKHVEEDCFIALQAIYTNIHGNPLS